MMPGNAFTASDKAVTTKLKPQQPEAQQVVMYQNKSIRPSCCIFPFALSYSHTDLKLHAFLTVEMTG